VSRAACKIHPCQGYPAGVGSLSPREATGVAALSSRQTLSKQSESYTEAGACNNDSACPQAGPEIMCRERKGYQRLQKKETLRRQQEALPTSIKEKFQSN